MKPDEPIDLIDYQKLHRVEAGLRLAIAERTGVEPEAVNGLDLHSFTVEDLARALELVEAMFPGEGC